MAMGKLQYDNWKAGKKLSRKGAVYAHCYECNGWEQSGEDCQGKENCALYPFSPSKKRY